MIREKFTGSVYGYGIGKLQRKHKHCLENSRLDAIFSSLRNHFPLGISIMLCILNKQAFSEREAQTPFLTCRYIVSHESTNSRPLILVKTHIGFTREPTQSFVPSGYWILSPIPILSFRPLF